MFVTLSLQSAAKVCLWIGYAAYYLSIGKRLLCCMSTARNESPPLPTAPMGHQQPRKCTRMTVSFTHHLVESSAKRQGLSVSTVVWHWRPCVHCSVCQLLVSSAQLCYSCFMPVVVYGVVSSWLDCVHLVMYIIITRLSPYALFLCKSLHWVSNLCCLCVVVMSQQHTLQKHNLHSLRFLEQEIETACLWEGITWKLSNLEQ